MAKQTTTQIPASSNQAKAATTEPIKVEASATAPAPTADPKPPLENTPVATTAAPIEPVEQKAKEEPVADATETDSFVMISAPHDRRRAGMNFGKNPIKVNVSTLTKEKVLAIQDDPVLVIRPLSDIEE